LVIYGIDVFVVQMSIFVVLRNFKKKKNSWFLPPLYAFLFYFFAFSGDSQPPLKRTIFLKFHEKPSLIDLTVVTLAVSKTTAK
jgi:hypothetical protein